MWVIAWAEKNPIFWLGKSGGQTNHEPLSYASLVRNSAPDIRPHCGMKRSYFLLLSCVTCCMSHSSFLYSTSMPVSNKCSLSRSLCSELRGPFTALCVLTQRAKFSPDQAVWGPHFCYVNGSRQYSLIIKPIGYSIHMEYTTARLLIAKENRQQPDLHNVGRLHV